MYRRENLSIYTLKLTSYGLLLHGSIDKRKTELRLFAPLRNRRTIVLSSTVRTNSDFAPMTLRDSPDLCLRSLVEKWYRCVFCTNVHCIDELQTTRKIRIHLEDLVIKFRDFMSSRNNTF